MGIRGPTLGSQPPGSVIFFEQEQGMITGAVEEAVVGYAFLVAMGRVDGTIF